MCNEEKKCNNCIKEILCVILILQENASCFDSDLEGCDRGFLGQCSPSCVYNTRPVMIYTCNGQKLLMPSEKSSIIDDSPVFRIEKIDKECATFRVLKLGENKYESTNSFFTINLSCICSIRCLPDIFIDCL